MSPRIPVSARSSFDEGKRFSQLGDQIADCRVRTICSKRFKQATTTGEQTRDTRRKRKTGYKLKSTNAFANASAGDFVDLWYLKVHCGATMFDLMTRYSRGSESEAFSARGRSAIQVKVNDSR